MIYFDTTYLFRLYFSEPGSGAVQRLAATDQVGSAAHGQAEMLAALHRKLREQAISRDDYAALLEQLQQHFQEAVFSWLPFGAGTFEALVRAYRGLPASVFLRARDAIHLATAAECGFNTIYSNDARLLAAAPHFGIEGRDVIGAAG